MGITGNRRAGSVGLRCLGMILLQSGMVFDGERSISVNIDNHIASISAGLAVDQS